MRVQELMTKDVVTATKNTLIVEAAEAMSQRKVGLLVIMDERGLDVTGVLSDSDIIAKIVTKNLIPRQVYVEQVMSPNVISIKPDATVSEAANIMRSYRIKRLPVIENGRLVGIISSTDIIRSIVEMKKTLLNMALEF